MRDPRIEAVERRRRWLRIGLFVIILGTLPFYFLGFVLWGTAPPRATAPITPLASLTPIGAGVTVTAGLPTVTPMSLTMTNSSPLLPTPLQFVPLPALSTATPFGGLSTPVFIPSSTVAPSLTPFPTLTAAPTLTPLPVITNTPLPPLPTETPTWTPTFTETPTATNTEVFVLPSETPLPFDPPTADPGTPSGG